MGITRYTYEEIFTLLSNSKNTRPGRPCLIRKQKIDDIGNHMKIKYNLYTQHNKSIDYGLNLFEINFVYGDSCNELLYRFSIHPCHMNDDILKSVYDIIENAANKISDHMNIISAMPACDKVFMSWLMNHHKVMPCVIDLSDDKSTNIVYYPIKE